MKFSPKNAFENNLKLNSISYMMFSIPRSDQLPHSVLRIVLWIKSFGSIVGAPSIFCFQIEKHSLNELHAPSLGANLALDIVAFFMLVFSDHSFVTLEKETMSQDLGREKTAATLRRFLVLKSSGWQECHAQHSHLGIKLEVLETPLLFRRWSVMSI
ncbi:hypothetical protein WN943_023760 [Citrus x changshan-huyou]